MSPRSSACNSRQALENQGDSANSCPADQGTRWLTAKRAISGVDFDHMLKLKFLGGQVTKDAGMLAYGELDEALGLTEIGAVVLIDSRQGSNKQPQGEGLRGARVAGR